MDIVARRQIAIWLFVCCAMVFATLVVGGVTRLNHAGLSIVEWQPLVGAIPPMNPGEWSEVFHKYQQTPEFLKINSSMTIDEFKVIFYWEYAHRVLGRTIGLVFLLPFLYFALRRKIGRKLAPKLIGMFFLGGLQGAMGWYMVKSGLVDNPHVSQYRLAAHLGLAFIIFASMFWVALGLLTERGSVVQDRMNAGLPMLRRFAGWLVLTVFIMVLSGALVAGLHAGLAWNSFPLMYGYFVPPDMFAHTPWLLNFFDNPTTVQFDHRLIAWLLAFLAVFFWIKSRRVALDPRARLATHLVVLAFALQITLGIATLLLVVPVPLAAAHQAGAMLLFATLLWLNHELRK
ncbi:MAG TPA: COX15/CtaA family protein [Rhodocyclaceae bacterium]|nr:COX15/CtaA family protein [Rhodocyclaceae bacterium]